MNSSFTRGIAVSCYHLINWGKKDLAKNILFVEHIEYYDQFLLITMDPFVLSALRTLFDENGRLILEETK